jgi:hypothetical protein
MIETVFKNEIYMSARYIKSKGLQQDGVAIVGTHHCAEYLKATTK